MSIASEQMVDAITKAETAEKIVEIGVGLIAMGLFRTNREQGPDEAQRLASVASNTLLGLHLDFIGLASKRQP